MELRLGKWQDVLADVQEVDSVICDPPFDKEAHTLQRRVKRGPSYGVVGIDGRKACNAPLSFEPLSFETRTEAGGFIESICKGWAVVFCQVESTQEWRFALEPMAYRRTCVWIKPDGMPQFSGDRPGMGYESIVCCYPAGKSKWNGGGRKGTFEGFRDVGRDVFRHNKNSGGKHIHQTQKPIPLIRELVRLFTNPNDLICDPYAGSGSVLLAAATEGRRCIGAEYDPKTYALAVKRLERGYTPSFDFS